ncbi:MAG TPA: pilus assembly protein PilM, partial [Planctomycetaceae bacterium]|nr:pilus assembly protein PilM [Planctomycetaceae bacterium]
RGAGVLPGDEGAFAGGALGGGVNRPRIGANRPEKEVKPINLQRTQFTLEFVWKPIPVLERQENPPETPATEGESAGEEATAEAG